MGVGSTFTLSVLRLFMTIFLFSSTWKHPGSRIPTLKKSIEVDGHAVFCLHVPLPTLQEAAGSLTLQHRFRGRLSQDVKPNSRFPHPRSPLLHLLSWHAPSKNKKPGIAPPPAFEPFLPDLNLEDDPYSLRGDSATRSQRAGSGSHSRIATKTPNPESNSISGEVAAAAESSSNSGTTQVVPVGPPLARRNDILLPRTALVLWSFITLVALLFAFAAGFLAGRSL